MMSSLWLAIAWELNSKRFSFVSRAINVAAWNKIQLTTLEGFHHMLYSIWFQKSLQQYVLQSYMEVKYTAVQKWLFNLFHQIIEDWYLLVSTSDSTSSLLSSVYGWIPILILGGQLDRLNLDPKYNNAPKRVEIIEPCRSALCQFAWNDLLIFASHEAYTRVRYLNFINGVFE